MPLVGYAVCPFVEFAWVLAAAAAVLRVLRLVIRLMRVRMSSSEAQRMRQPVFHVRLQRMIAGSTCCRQDNKVYAKNQRGEGRKRFMSGISVAICDGFVLA